MGYKNNKSHRDGNHAEITEALESVGWRVQDTSMCPNFVDIVIAKTQTIICEVKELRGKFEISQLETLANWSGDSVILTSKDDVLIFNKEVKDFKYFIGSQRQKNALLLESLRAKNSSKSDSPTLAVSKVLKLILENK